jgi:DNA (cytosine-5)-methyltransferase 1
MNELALFAGAGGGILGGHLLGWRTVCAVEWEPYAACVLAVRQNDGLLPPFPIWDDVQTFDGRPWRGIVDVISGGFPCQDISAAGKGAGIDGERSGMWREMARIVHEIRPRFVYVENSPMLTSRGLGTVLGDLAKMGFDAKWGVLGAADVGAPHQRDRIWIRARQRKILSYAEHNGDGWWEQQPEGVEKTDVANSHSVNDAVRGNSQNYEESMVRGGYELRGGVNNSGSGCEEGSRKSEGMANTNVTQRQGNQRPIGIGTQYSNSGSSSWWEAEPDVGRVADGVAARVDRLKAIGNGQVSLVAATAWEDLGGK